MGCNGGAGGAGLVSSITGTPVIYAAGGGGGTYNGNLVPGLSANGGNGGSISPFIGYSAYVNTGGGGGGNGSAQGVNPTGAGGAGGSGIVVIRYPNYLAPAASTTGSPTTYIAGPYRVYIWVASGSITF